MSLSKKEPESLLDIISLVELQSLQDSFADITGCASCILGKDSQPITAPSGRTDFCQLMLSNPLTRERCDKSRCSAAGCASVEGEAVSFECLNLSMAFASVPIYVSGKYMGNWLVGQRVVRRLSEAEVRNFAKAHNLDETTVLDLYNSVPLVSSDLAIRTAKLLNLFSSASFWEIYYKNYLLAEANRENSITANILQTVMSGTRSVIYVSDPTTSEIIFTNTYTNETLGYNPVGRLCHEVFQNNSTPCSFCPRLKLVEKLEKGETPELTWEHHNEALKKDYFLTDRLIQWHDGRLLHIEIGTDVTERNDLLVAEAANTAKRKFLAHMTHELRTPMNGVLGMTHLALQANPTGEQKTYLLKIKNSADVLLGIVNDILDFSKIEAGKVELHCQSFMLQHLLDNCYELITPRIADKDVEFTMHVAEDVPASLFGDAQRLTQILLNLLGNAAKFTNKGYIRLNVSVENTTEKDMLVAFSVADSGVGISKNEQALLFSSFSQANPDVSQKFGGTGLGLSISQRLAELMGGDIALESEEGKGSVFTVRVCFNYASAANLQEEVELEGSSALLFKDVRVLLVEDNLINQEIGMEILSQAGADVTLADNGKEALDILFIEKQQFDIILMDIQMPVMDGYTAAEYIRRHAEFDAIPIIAMTAHAFAENKEDCLAKGMNDHIAKPFELKAFYKILNHWIGKSKKN